MLTDEVGTPGPNPIDPMTAHLFPKVAEACSIAVEKAKAKKAYQKKLKVDQDRFFASPSADAGEALASTMPSSAKLTADVPNGRRLFSHPAFKIRSVSWSERGPEKAAKLILEEAWRWHTAATGEPMPDYLQDLGEA